MSEKPKFTKRIYCTNCEQSNTYRFDKGTDLRGRKVACDYCGVAVVAARPDPYADKALTVSGPTEPWSFMRDFFGLKGNR